MKSEQFVCVCHRPSTDSWLQIELPTNLGREMNSTLIVEWIFRELQGEWIPKDMQLGYEDMS